MTHRIVHLHHWRSVTDTVGTKKKSSTPITFDTTDDKGGSDKKSVYNPQIRTHLKSSQVTSMMDDTIVTSFKESKLWTRSWKTHWRQQSMSNCPLVSRMTKSPRESSPMMMTPHGTGNTCILRGLEVGRRKGVEEVVVIWTYTLALVCCVWYVSKRVVNKIIKWLDYQSNISKRLTIWLSKGLIIKTTSLNISFWLSKGLIIKPKNPIIKSINT
jgi:hypothetical protein